MRPSRPALRRVAPSIAQEVNPLLRIALPHERALSPRRALPPCETARIRQSPLRTRAVLKLFAKSIGVYVLDHSFMSLMCAGPHSSSSGHNRADRAALEPRASAPLSSGVTSDKAALSSCDESEPDAPVPTGIEARCSLDCPKVNPLLTAPSSNRDTESLAKS